MVIKNNSALYQLVWKYFVYPSETMVRRGRSAIESARKFCQLVWKMIVRAVENHKGRVSGDFIIILLFNQIFITEAIKRDFTPWLSILSSWGIIHSILNVFLNIPIAFNKVPHHIYVKLL